MQGTRWLILVDQRGLGHALATRLRSLGASAVLVEAAQGALRCNPDTGEWSADPADSSALERLSARLAATTGEPPLAAVVNLWSLDAATSERLSLPRLDTARRLGCESTLALVRGLSDRSDDRSPRLWLVTRGTVAAGTDPSVHGLAQAPLWGLGKSLALECPELWGGLIDLDPTAAPNEANALLETILEPGDEDQLVLRRGEVLVSRLERLSVAATRPTRLDGEALYLVTGGLGALGLHVARWLVARGAKALALLGRGAGSAQAQVVVERLRTSGASVTRVRADVADAHVLAEALDSLRAGGRRIAGVVHAAGVGDERPIMDLTAEDLGRMFSAKVAGAWNLHQLTLDMDLDLFVCFSSIASTWGSAGQGHYAAANQFLGALAHHRQSLGFAATTLCWGPWTGGGMASDTARARLERIGIESLSPEQALAALDRVLGVGEAETTVVRADWARLASLFRACGTGSLLARLAPAVDERPHGPRTPLRTTLEGLSAEGRRTHLTRHLAADLSTILGFDAGSRPDPQRGFFDLGMDSLTAIELKDRLSAALGTPLSPTIAFDYPSIEALADHLLGALGLPDGSAETADAAFREPARDDAGRSPDRQAVPPDDLDTLLESRLERLESLMESRP